MKPNDIVKYSRPQPGEEDCRFALHESNGNRVLLELICNMAIKPLETVSIEEVCPADG